MEIFWLLILAFMLTTYVILDGLDFGAGIVYLFFSKEEKDKEAIIKSIGPFWDGNEVWLIAGGGVLFAIFPVLYASAFSGLYLPLTLVLWMLIFRAVGLELRHLVDNKLWKQTWGAAFGVGSLMLALLFGIALGNVVRGVNLGGVENGILKYDPAYFFTPLWAKDFSPLNQHPGVIDWFTIILGVISVITLTIHGANWIIFKTNSGINGSLRKWSFRLSIVLVVMMIISFIAWLKVRPDALDNFYEMPILWLSLITVVVGLTGMLRVQSFKKDGMAFLFSTLFIVGSFVSTLLALFPKFLPSTNDQVPALDIYNTTTTEYGMRISVVWWSIAIVLVGFYFYNLHRTFRGKLDEVEYH